MTYFLAQTRHIQPLDKRQPDFPSELEFKIRFAPEDSFGVCGNAPRTTLKLGTSARIDLNANEGISSFEGELIEELSCRFEADILSGTWKGNVLTADVRVSSMEDVERIIHSANHVLPATLSFRLNVFVWIREFTAQIGNCQYNVETHDVRQGLVCASTEMNQDRSVAAVKDWVGFSVHSRRLVVAMYYFRQALRLEANQIDRQTMTAEVVLNLCKAIEAIFPGGRDTIRQKATGIGVDSELLEKRIIPLFLIRNELDVAHVALAPLLVEQKRSLDNFVSRATDYVHQLLSFIIEEERVGAIEFAPISESLDKHKERLLSQIAQYAAK